MVCKDTLKIKHLPKELTDVQKEDFVRHFGAISVKVITSKAKGKSLVYAKFTNEEVAKNVMLRLHQINVLNCRLCVEYAETDILQGKLAQGRVEDLGDVSDQKFFKTFINKIHAFNDSVGFHQPPPSHLKYNYPKANRPTINNIAHALATVPRFYTQVLHLMNKMNLPPPFAMPDPPVRTIQPTQQRIPSSLPSQKPQENITQPAPVSSSESELESDDESNKNKEIIPQKRTFPQKKVVKRPKFIKQPAVPVKDSAKPVEKPEDVFETVNVQTQKKIELKVMPDSIKHKEQELNTESTLPNNKPEPILEHSISQKQEPFAQKENKPESKELPVPPQKTVEYSVDNNRDNTRSIEAKSQNSQTSQNVTEKVLDTKDQEWQKEQTFQEISERSTKVQNKDFEKLVSPEKENNENRHAVTLRNQKEDIQNKESVQKSVVPTVTSPEPQKIISQKVLGQGKLQLTIQRKYDTRQRVTEFKKAETPKIEDSKFIGPDSVNRDNTFDEKSSSQQIEINRPIQSTAPSIRQTHKQLGEQSQNAALQSVQSQYSQTQKRVEINRPIASPVPNIRQGQHQLPEQIQPPVLQPVQLQYHQTQQVNTSQRVEVNRPLKSPVPTIRQPQQSIEQTQPVVQQPLLTQYNPIQKVNICQSTEINRPTVSPVHSIRQAQQPREQIQPVVQQSVQLQYNQTLEVNRLRTSVSTRQVPQQTNQYSVQQNQQFSQVPSQGIQQQYIQPQEARPISSIVTVRQSQQQPMEVSQPMGIPVQQFQQVEPDESEEADDEFPCISLEELAANQITDFSAVPIFKNYNVGQPTNKLYIKNCAKTVVLQDLEYIYNRYREDTKDRPSEFNIRLMQEGRMKGQAFVTLDSVEMAEKAVKETNGFILKDKPLVVAFGKAGTKTK